MGRAWLVAAVALLSWATAKTTVTVGLDADPPNLDPVFSSALVDRQVLNQIYDKLLDIDQDLKIVPMLATSWSVGNNGTVYTFKLRQGVKFHDGTDFDAEAVKFNLDRALTAEGSRRKGELAPVKEVQVVDKYTVRVVLKDAFSPFLYVLTDRAGMMVSPAAAKRYGQDLANNPVGTGPFRFVERKRQDRIVLQRNEGYWKRGYPKIDELIYRPFPDDDVRLANLLSGAVTVITPVAPKDLARVRGDANLNLFAFPSLGFQGVWLNVTRPPLQQQGSPASLCGHHRPRHHRPGGFPGHGHPGQRALSSWLPGLRSQHPDSQAGHQPRAEKASGGGLCQRLLLHPANHPQPCPDPAGPGLPGHGRRGGDSHSDSTGGVRHPAGPDR